MLPINVAAANYAGSLTTISADCGEAVSAASQRQPAFGRMGRVYEIAAVIKDAAAWNAVTATDRNGSGADEEF